MFSSDKGEIGTALDIRGEACYACHAEGSPLEKLDIQARARIFPASDGTRVLGIINPIPNEASCSTAACHAHSPTQRILGVLDVNVSMAEADTEIARSRAMMGALAVMAFLASSLILWWLNRQLVLKPVTALLEGTRRVADGDLATTIPVMAHDELGDLATAFNQMTHRLAETQLQLAHADKLASVGRLAAGIAHEINNPLTGVLSYASLLKKRFESDISASEDLDVIIRETLRCRGIIRGLLDFARPTPPSRKPTDLNEVVRHAVAVVMKQLQLSHVSLALDLAEDLPTTYADANQIQQVMVNLLLNAADALGLEGGEIRLSSLAHAERVALIIEDNGQGIPAENLSHLFEPFFSTKGTRGTGLGLAVTWGIIESHGGTIDVQSEPGHGARFTVSLPVMPPPAAVKPSSETPFT